VSFEQYSRQTNQARHTSILCPLYVYCLLLLEFEIFTEKDNEAAAVNDGAAEAVVDRLITNAHLIQARGRILYTILTIGTHPLVALQNTFTQNTDGR